MVKWAVKRPDATGTDRNSDSLPCRSRYFDDRAREYLIWNQRKRLSRCLASGPSAEAWSVSHCQISDARRSLAASLVIFWAFLGIRASAAGARDGKIDPRGRSRAGPARNLPGEEDGEREMSRRDGDRLVGIRSLTKSQLASLCFLFTDHQGDR